MDMTKKIGRNEKCPCGSGKKYKNCCINKIPRRKCSYIGFSEKFERFAIDDNGDIFIIKNGEEYLAETCSRVEYEGENKIVILNSIPRKFILNVPKYLNENFDKIYAIDTNTKTIENNKISISSISESYFGDIIEDKINFHHRKFGNILSKNIPKDLEEKFAWTKLIELISKIENKKLRYCIITDHDLQNHDRYNKRELPIIDNIHLPDNFTLLFAKGHKESQDVRNMLLTNCDNDANRILRDFEAKKSIIFNDKEVLLEQIYTFPYVTYLLGN